MKVMINSCPTKISFYRSSSNKFYFEKNKKFLLVDIGNLKKGEFHFSFNIPLKYSSL